jgi:hypothetical protein
MRDGALEIGAGQKSQGENSMQFNERVDTRGPFSSLYFVKIT